MIFFHKESNLKQKFFMGGLGGGEARGGVDEWTDEQAQTNLPFNFFELGGTTMH